MDALLQSRAQELATEFASQATTVEELNELMRLMMKSGLERMLDAELDVHLGRRSAPTAATAAAPASPRGRSPNRRNGRSRKTVQGDLGEVTLSTPRDRDGTFEPQLIEKHQRRVPGFDEKILALYAKGMTTRDIQEIVRELYGVDVSATLVSAITEDLDAEVTAWRTRPCGAPTAGSRSTPFTWPWASIWPARRSSWGCGSARTRAPSSGSLVLRT
jgi:putative transposase